MTPRFRKIIKWSSLFEMVGLSRSTVDRLEKAGKFPARIRLAQNSVGWRLDEINGWLDSRERGIIPENPAKEEARRRCRARQEHERKHRPDAA